MGINKDQVKTTMYGFVSLFIACVLFGSYIAYYKSTSGYASESSVLAQDISISKINDYKKLKLSSALSPDKPTLAIFSSTDCTVCDKQDNEIINDTNLAQDFNVIYVYSSGSSSVKAGKLEKIASIYWDPYKELQKKYRMEGTPGIFMFDRSGEMQFKHLGFISASGIKNKYAKLSKQ